MTPEYDNLGEFDFLGRFNMGDRSPRRVDFAHEFLEDLPQILPVVAPHADLSTFYYPETGMNGVVFMVDSVKEDKRQRHVFKANLDKDLLHAQAAVLREYAEVGITVPEITEIEATSDQPYYLHRMNYVDRPLLSSTTGPDRIARGLSRQMGELIARGHIRGYEGYGSLDPESETIRGTHETFEEHIKVEVIERRLLPLINAGVFDNEQLEQAEFAMQMLSRDLAKGTEPVLVNVDLSPNNIFGGEQGETLIVFDPKPKISHPLLDLANTRMNSYSYTGNLDEFRKILEGYESVEGEVNNELLDAATYLTAIYKLHSFWKKGKAERCERLIGIIQNLDIIGRFK